MNLILEILQTATGIKNAADAAFRPTGVTPSQFNVLNLLAKNNEMTASALAKELVVDPSNITGLLQRMQRDKLVTTVPTQDKRQRLVQLTAEGRKRWSKASEIYTTELARVIALLNDTEILITQAALQKVRNAVQPLAQA